MYKFDNQLFNQGRFSPSNSLLFFLGFLFVGFFSAQLIGTFIALPFFENDVNLLQKVLLTPENHHSYGFAFTLLQGIISVISFIAIPLLFLYFIERKNLTFLEKEHTTPKGILYGYTFLIVFAIMPTTSLLVEWNSNITFPASLSSFENQAREYEEMASRYTALMTDFSSVAHLILAFVVVGIVAGIGEEIVFRGIIQNYIHAVSKNPHTAIWVAAFLFSAIHFQFYGFFPRMILGAVFGYLYFWSKDFMIPVFAHFLNNASTVLLLYLNKKGILQHDIEDTTALPISAIVPSFLVACLLLFLFYKKCSNK